MLTVSNVPSYIDIVTSESTAIGMGYKKVMFRCEDIKTIYYKYNGSTSGTQSADMAYLDDDNTITIVPTTVTKKTFSPISVSSSYKYCLFGSPTDGTSQLAYFVLR